MSIDFGRRLVLLRIPVVFGFAAIAAACTKAKFEYMDITGVEIGGDFQLTDHNGHPRSLSDFRGKVVAVFFGFTHCPDVCPTTLAELAQTVKRLGARGDEVQILFITVDPARDTKRCSHNMFRPSIRGFWVCTAIPRRQPRSPRRTRCSSHRSRRMRRAITRWTIRRLSL